MAVNVGDRVKSTAVHIHEPGMPYVTRYGTINFAEPDGSYSLIGVMWDNGDETPGFDRHTVVPIELKLPHPEPLAYLNPIHPSGSQFIGDKRREEWSTTFDEYEVKVRELETELATRPWR